MSNGRLWPYPARTIRNSTRTGPGRRGRWNNVDPPTAARRTIATDRNRPKWTPGGGPSGQVASANNRHDR
jgi:hypothetical protein